MEISYNPGEHTRNYEIVISRAELVEAQNSEICTGLSNHSEILPVRFSVGRTKFAKVDREYSPNYTFPMSEIDEIHFIMRDCLVEKLKEDGEVVSELETGNVVVLLEN